MDAETVDYIRRLIPENVPDGMAFVRRGMELGRGITPRRAPFLEEAGFANYMEYRRDRIARKKVVCQILLGLASLPEQLAAIREIHDFSRRTGLEIDTVQALPSQLVALPESYRAAAPAGTSYVMAGEADWLAHAEASPLQIIFGDQHLSCPNALETVANPLKAGSARVGLFSQFIWDYPGFDDDLQRYSDMLTGIGMVAAHRDAFISVDSYLDDGLPGYFMDCVSYVGYALLEHYICSTLCRARMSFSYGGLLSEGRPRMAVGMAIDRLLSTADQPALSYINSSTIIQWDHDVNANFGPSVAEMLLEILVERKYGMGMAINPVAVTERLRVPSLPELLDICAAGARAEEMAPEWDELMDFRPLEKMRDVMAAKGEDFFRNVLAGFGEAGVDIGNPLEMLLVLKRFNPTRFEQAFHPGEEEDGSMRVYYPTVLGRQTAEMREGILAAMRERGLEGRLAGKRVVAASADGHSYGLLLVEGVLAAMGAEVLNAGVDAVPATLLDFADESGVRDLCVSVHNGQALAYGKQLVHLAKERGGGYRFFMGGKLNGMLPGGAMPVEVDGMLRELGIVAGNDLAETIVALAE